MASFKDIKALLHTGELEKFRESKFVVDEELTGPEIELNLKKFEGKVVKIKLDNKFFNIGSDGIDFVSNIKLIIGHMQLENDNELIYKIYDLRESCEWRGGNTYLYSRYLKYENMNEIPKFLAEKFPKKLRKKR